MRYAPIAIKALAIVLMLAAPVHVSGAASSQRPAGAPPGPGGPGRAAPGPTREIALVARFDRDGDKRLNANERDTAREFVSGSDRLKTLAEGRRAFLLETLK